jgi:ATP adenylyltransferase/5',5'''-P-1,P-4-tetraphosphate phosphorylase II
LLIVQIDPSLRTPYSLLLPTKDYHEQSAPLRPAYLTHAHRLLVAMEDGLERAEELGRRKVVAVYDCGEKSGVRIGHKCVRFFMVDVAASESSPCEESLHPVL